MSAQNTGGPAFPVADPFAVKCPSTETEALSLQQGMTLRDYFAAKAMPIMWDAYDKGYCGLNDKDEPNVKTIAEGAYQMADAMLEARKK